MKKTEKIFIISTLLLVIAAVASIPDKGDRILAFAVFGIIVLSFLVACGWDHIQDIIKKTRS